MSENEMTAAPDSEKAGNGAADRRDPNEPVAIVGLGASAGGVAVLQQFFSDMPADSGLAFVVVMHLSPDFESQLAAVIQHKTAMQVVQVNEASRGAAEPRLCHPSEQAAHVRQWVRCKWSSRNRRLVGA